jgi:hypothetical protein
MEERPCGVAKENWMLLLRMQAKEASYPRIRDCRQWPNERSRFSGRTDILMIATSIRIERSFPWNILMKNLLR